MNLKAINIFIYPSKEVSKFCKYINKLDKSDYFEENLPYIPHITLYQKVFSQDNLKNLIDDLKNLKTNKFEIELWNIFNRTLFWIDILRNEKLNNLQKEIIKIVSKYKIEKVSKNSFIVWNNFYENTINWVKDYGDYIDFNKNLHITIWKDILIEKTTNIKIPKKFIFEKLWIWIMWNYCSVRSIIEII